VRPGERRRAPRVSSRIVAIGLAVAAVLAGACCNLATASPRPIVSHSWTTHYLPRVEVPNGTLSGVSCPSAADCVGVGRTAYGYLCPTFCDVDDRTAPLAEALTPSEAAIQPIGNPLGVTASLASVSCTSSRFCIAVGHQDPYVALAQMWDGERWKPSRMPTVGGRIWSMNSVSCTSRSFCEAVGWVAVDPPNGDEERDPLIFDWDGSKWARQSTASTQAVLTGVSCSSRSACMAVGHLGEQSDSQATLSLVWNGVDWTSRIVPAPTAPATLTAVSCPNASFCLAVGDQPNGDDDFGLVDNSAFADLWNGNDWSLDSGGSLSAGEAGELVAVSCPSDVSCEAVGTAPAGEAGSPGPPVMTYTPTASAWNGSSWTRQFPAPPTTSAIARHAFTAVSCAAVSRCTAVGGGYESRWTPPPPLYHANVERLVGASWVIAPVVQGEGVAAATSLSGVSCPSRRDCTAVGSTSSQLTSDDRWTNDIPVAFRWNGNSWRREQFTFGKAGLLFAVSCPVKSFCAVTGFKYDHYPPTDRPLVRVWDGQTWRATKAPAAPTTNGTRLNAVSCTSPRFCLAAGNGDGNSATVPVVETWNGSSWAPSLLAHDGLEVAELSAVSCASPTYCVAVGDQRTRDSGRLTPLAEEFDGRQWHERSLDLPESVEDAGFDGVSCTATACMAVGHFMATPTDEVRQSFAAQLIGTSWHVTYATGYTSAAPPPLAAVSCSSADRCVAVTGSVDRDGQQTTTAIRWNGRRWHTEPTPSLPSNAGLGAVACRAHGFCMAAGAILRRGVRLPLTQLRSR
jgi:hypothetical protein